MVHILNWQTDGDYCKDNALHMSNDLQIIYVTFPSIIVFAEDINCVTNIKLSAKRAELSFLLSENAEPSAPRQTCIWPSFVRHLTQCEGFLLEMPTREADDVCVSSVLWLPGPRRCARSHLISSTSCAPRCVRHLQQYGFWHTLRWMRPGVKIWLQILFQSGSKSDLQKLV